MGTIDRIAGSFAATVLAVAAVSIAAIVMTTRLFGLTGGGATALYFVIWWISLFAVLPFGARSQVESGEVFEGSEPGAPAAPRLREKALWTTVVAAAILILVGYLLPLAGL
jgi:predicted secreted protein